MGKTVFLKKKSKGYSLVEIMIVIAIIGVLMTVLLPRVGKLFKMVKDMRAQFALKNVQNKINEYTLDTGVYPQKLEDLMNRPTGHAGKGWRGGYVEKDEEWPPVDSKGSPIIYSSPPQVFKDRFEHYELYSVGDEDPETGNKDNFVVVGG